MQNNDCLIKDHILEQIKKVSVCCVSTYTARHIRNRMMHFAVSPDFKFYLSSISTDPKIKQITLNSQISLLIYIPGNSFPEDIEVEVNGYAKMINQKEKAVELLIDRSPVVAQLKKYNKLDMLSFIEIIPIQVKFRQVKDILQGISPTVIEFEHHYVSDNDWEKFKRKLNAWITEMRYPFLSVTILPVLLGTVIAWTKNNVFNFLHFILTLLAASFLHLGTNVINDYFDHKSGNDEVNTEFVRPFSGGSRMIQLGLLTPLEVLVGAIVFFISGIAIGIYLTYKCGIIVLLLGLIGVISGFFYTGGVFNWASKGIGELLVGVNFGVLVPLGSYYVQTKILNLEVLLASVPMAILITAILWINEIPDYNADKKVKKNTLVVRLGKEKSAQIFVYILLSSYIFLIVGVILGYLPKITLVGLVSLPFAIQSIIYVKKFYNNSFDMAAGNGFTILCFNILGLVFVNSYLWLSVKNIYILPTVLFSLFYILWHYNNIKVQTETYTKLKSLVT
ncbi:MAG: 1,4-dihydroxy-2-naphthoate octaprenyltransferase [Endomicrobiia bacterium]